MMTRENYRSCEYLEPERGNKCAHPGKDDWEAWSDMGSCAGCDYCPLGCGSAADRPAECPHGRAKKAHGMNTLPAAEGGAE